MTVSQAKTRALCANCGLPSRSCICPWAVAIRNHIEVLVLQHPLEVANAKNSVRLMRLCLAKSRTVVGERFATEELETMLRQPVPGAEGNDPPQAMLLYPDTPGLGPSPSVTLPSNPERLRLVVLDGTWRKSRRLFEANPALAGLPRLALADPPPSRYRIRRARRADQLSTLEAVCHALALLEGEEERYAPLLAAFDAFVAQRLAFVPGGEER